MNLIGREWSELSALYLKTVIHVFDLIYTLSSANIDESALNLGKIFLSNRICMGPIGQNNWSYLLLNWEKLLHSTLFTL